jgi:hypothetical protein
MNTSSPETPLEGRSSNADYEPQIAAGDSLHPNTTGTSEDGNAHSNGSSDILTKHSPLATNGTSHSATGKQADISQPADRKGMPRGIKLGLKWAGGVVVVAGLTLAVILTWFPSIVVRNLFEPKIKGWVHAKLGDRYSVDIAGITINAGRDSLLLTGVKIIDLGRPANGRSLVGDEGSNLPALEKLIIDTIRIAGVDYWKLLSQDGLLAGSILMHGPKIYLRPGSLPNFASDHGILPDFLPVVSSKSIVVDDAQIYLADAEGDYLRPSSSSEDIPTGLTVKHASLRLRDFYLDQKTNPLGSGTLFSKSVEFDASDITHRSAHGITDLVAGATHGDLIDSSLHVASLRSDDPAKGIRRISCENLAVAGLDWNSVFKRQGIKAARATITAPQVYLQDDLKLNDLTNPTGFQKHFPLPKFVHSLNVGTVAVTNGEVMNILPGTRKINSLKRVSLVLHDLALDSSSLMSGITTLFSRDADFSIKGTTTLSLASGTAHFSNLHGDAQNVAVGESGFDATPSSASKIYGIKRVKLASLTANGIDWSKLLTRKGLFAGSVILKSPHIEMAARHSTGIRTESDTAAVGDPLAAIMDVFANAKKSPVPDFVPVIAAGTIAVTDGTISGVGLFDGPATPATAKPNTNTDSIPRTADIIRLTSLHLKNFHLDPTSYVSNRGRLFSKTGNFLLGDFSHPTTDGMYSLGFSILHGDLGSQTLALESLKLQPLLSEDAFAAKEGNRTERATFFAPLVSVSGFDFQKFLTGRGLFADSIRVANWNLDLYCDKRQPPEQRPARAVYPNEALQHLTSMVGVKMIAVKNGIFTFRDRYEDSGSVGVVKLDSISAQIGPVSNDLSVVSRDQQTTINGDLRVMDTAHFRFVVDYQLMNPELRLTAKGILDSMNGALFNNYLVAAEPFRLLGGIVEGTELSVEARDSMIHVLTLPLYDDLRVEFFKAFILPAGVATFLGNLFFVRAHNTLEKDHPPHTGEITMQMDRRDSFWWSIWLPLRQAIDKVLGIPDNIW